ncbi:MAG: DNA-directed RNA polymerase subunit beta [Candidatus Marinimicrobia bacterium]|nr:DNA-directed RNA polymerase subunit beta [Candidatus Neomarinimicrobiota bacterium]
MKKNKVFVERESFAKIKKVIDIPDLLSMQHDSFNRFIQADKEVDKREKFGLQKAFTSVFPVVDNHEIFLLDFESYSISRARYSENECVERGITYSVPLKAKMTLKIAEEDAEPGTYSESIEQEVFLGNIPYMTKRGSFIINGAERAIVSQLQRSPGVFFNDARHPNGTILYNARIIPMRGSWIDLTTDIFDAIYVTIDRRKKFPVSILLRAMGFSSDYDILNKFDIFQKVKVNDDIINEKIVTSVIDDSTGELIIEAGITKSESVQLTKKHLTDLKKAKIKEIEIVNPDKEVAYKLLSNSIRKERDKITKERLEEGGPTKEDALIYLYRNLKNGEPPSLEIADKFVERLFFSPKKYDLGEVGRYRMNKKFNFDTETKSTVITQEDLIYIIQYLINMRRGDKLSDDIDHLGNRRIKTVGEQLSEQFSISFMRMARTIRDRMNVNKAEELTPSDLVNSRIITSVINTFFGTSQMSQFMDQTNPLAELTHKRRLSALGPGGLTRERAGFEVRDVHYTHYGRLCPIETPEGPNIGLISSLASYAVINRLGFIESPYRKVTENNGKIVVSDDVEYLSADDEDRNVIAQANAELKDDGEFKNNAIKCRHEADYPVVEPENIDYMDVNPVQMVSAAASVIPFLENDDANRALMGSNMQRQSVPLLFPKTPYVGTGLERKVAIDSRAVLTSDVDGVVEYVDAGNIKIKTKSFDKLDFVDNEGRVEYKLKKYKRTNQNTAINQTPLVKQGQKVKIGEPIADGISTDRGELALGRNVLVAFMPWYGYNYEDAIILSERLVKDDVFTSIYVKEIELEVRQTKMGGEELTREIPNVSEEATKDLGEDGIIRIGAKVKEDDIIIGKVMPKGETDPTQEEKLLRAIFGEKASNVKDASKRVKHGTKGTVVDTKLFSRKGKSSRKEEAILIKKMEKNFEMELARIRKAFAEKMVAILKDEKCQGVKGKAGNSLLAKNSKWSEEFFIDIDLRIVDLEKPWIKNKNKYKNVNTLIVNFRNKIKEKRDDLENEKYKIKAGDDLQPGVLNLAKVYIANKRKVQVGDKMAGRHGNKGVVSIIVPEEDMPYLPDGTPVDIILNPLGVPSRMNLGQLYETMLGWAAKELNTYFETPVFDGATYKEIQAIMKKTGLPESGKSILFDGKTGDQISKVVAVGYIYMMKLGHMIEDKLHARSTGPYSLITQQPLGGKAQMGGQRFGEMEVWALEAYGAAHTLQEVLTVKSDDVDGRTKVYNALVKGENLPEYGIPESFNVLLRELQGLGIEVEMI